MKVRGQSIIGAEPLMCTMNVKKRIAALGGTAVFGWHVKYDPNLPITHLSQHCIWQSPDGELQDVTPHFTGVEAGYAIVEFPESIEFLPDPDAYFEVKGTGKYVPSENSPPKHSRKGKVLARACHFMTIADEHMAAADIEKCRYWTDRANAEMRMFDPRVRGWDTPSSINMSDVVPTFIA